MVLLNSGKGANIYSNCFKAVENLKAVVQFQASCVLLRANMRKILQVYIYARECDVLQTALIRIRIFQAVQQWHQSTVQTLFCRAVI